jgi:hypothetical protein
MINKQMNENRSTYTEKKGANTQERTPNERAGYYFSSSIKIFDPNSKEVMVQKRGDD